MRQRILRAALELCAKRGLSGTTVEDITNAADVGRGTFFNYFPTKEHIFITFAEMQVGKITEFVSHHRDSVKPVDRLLYELAVSLTEPFSNSPTLVQSLLAAVFSNERLHTTMAEGLKEGRKALAGFMSICQQRGDLRDDLSPLQLAFGVQRAVFGTMVLWSIDPSKPLSDCLDEMSKILWPAIRNPAKDPEKGKSP